MNKRIIIIWVLLSGLLGFSLKAFAQDVQVQRSESTVTIGGKLFYMHHVKAGETLYAISKAYHVSIEQIQNYNPELKQGVLREKMVIGIPYVEETEVRRQEAEVRSQETEVRRQETEAFSRTVQDTIVEVAGKRYVMHYVKPGETVWGLSQSFHVTEAEILEKNPEVKEGLKAGMVIGIPYVEETEDRSQETEVETQETDVQYVVEPPVSDDDEYFDGYVIHTVKKAEKTKSLAQAWNVSLEEFRQLNPSVGSRVFVGQKVLIPYVGVPKTASEKEEQPGVDEPVVVQPVDEPITEGTGNQDLVLVNEMSSGGLLYSGETPVECAFSMANADQLYHVALLVPLYLGDTDKLDASRDRAEKTKKTRAMKFLQFYEGFMMAVDSLTNHYGLRLELTVMDVTENVSGAEAAVEKLRGKDMDLIIGPFFSKSFAIVQEYASNHNILIVNPLSERESVVAEASNVLKLKPSMQAMVTELGDLIRNRYPKSKVTLMTPSQTKDTVMVQALDQMLATLVPPEVQLSNTEMLELIAKESRRRKMGKRVLSNLEVEGQIFSTKALEAHPDDVTRFENHYQHLIYSDNEVKTFVNGLSAARENVLVAYGDDLVFATKILNNINKSVQNYPITLIGLPQWGNFENLLVQNLLNMNAIFFDDHFVDYNDSTVLCFVDDFRAKYASEPMEYAYEGFDVGWYFLNALMAFGSHPAECLPYYHLPLLHSNYYFNKSRWHDGLENRYWNIYQYDARAVELKPVLIYSEKEN